MARRRSSRRVVRVRQGRKRTRGSPGRGAGRRGRSKKLGRARILRILPGRGVVSRVWVVLFRGGTKVRRGLVGAERRGANRRTRRSERRKRPRFPGPPGK